MSSNAVFPTPVLQQWGVTWPVKKHPIYSTIVRTPQVGIAEVRLPLYAYPRWAFELDLSYLKSDFSNPAGPLATVVGFYMQMAGAAQDWLYTDPYDHTVNGEASFGTGDGSTTQFQLTRNIQDNQRQSVDIIQNLNGAPTIYLSGVAQPTNSYTISATGVVTFTSPPPAGHTLTWAGAFYFRCRFVEDTLATLQEDLYQIWSLHSLKFLSVILPTVS